MSTSRRKLLRYAGAASGALAAGGTVSAAGPDKAVADPFAFAAAFAKRQTVRRYKSTPVPDEELHAILDAARRGPCCMNQQAWKFLVIKDKAKIEAMKEKQIGAMLKYFDGMAAKPNANIEQIQAQKEKARRFSEGYFTAPVYVVVLVDKEAPCAGYAKEHDGPIAAGYLMLAARAFGYGTAYLTDGIREDVAREVLNIPERYHRICITPIGVPDGWPKQAPKRKLEEHVAYETLEGHPPLERIPYNPS